MALVARLLEVVEVHPSVAEAARLLEAVEVHPSVAEGVVVAEAAHLLGAAEVEGAAVLPALAGLEVRRTLDWLHTYPMMVNTAMRTDTCPALAHEHFL